VLSNVEVYDTAEAVARAAADLFVRTAGESIRDHGRFSVALSGGSTPKRAFQLLATKQFSDEVDWSRVHLFWGDERYVPADDANSNYRMTREALLHAIAIPAANVHRVPTELTPPDAAATDYQEEIGRHFGNGASPDFDLIYLGLGTNGHTASLFPHSQILHESARWVAAEFVAEVDQWRISMTVPLLNRGRVVAFLVTGADKAGVLREVLVGALDPERLPAQLISPRALWLVDHAAAAQLPLTGGHADVDDERASQTR
jgi:6-phosphogluconolactonase